MMRSVVLGCVLAGVLMLAGCGGDGAKKTLEGTWNCANFITVRVDTEQMLLTPVAFLGIPVPRNAPDFAPAKITLKNISNDSLEMGGGENDKGNMRIRFTDANTAEVSLNASKQEIEQLKAQIPGFDGTFTCKRVK